MSNPLRVLAIEDNPDDAELLALQLASGGYDVDYLRVDTAADLQAALAAGPWDIILTDYSMPQFDAIAALTIVQASGQDIPFIIVSGSIGEETAVAAMQAGSHDYLLKSNLTRLVPAVKRELREAQVRDERRQALRDLEQLAFYDLLTGLPNRSKFLLNLQDWIEHRQTDPEAHFSVIFLDIDRYKRVKYGLGHQKGHDFLVEVGQRLVRWAGPNDLVAHIEEDSFAIALRHVANTAVLAEKVAQVHGLMEEPFQLGALQIYSSASLGIVDSNLPYTVAADFLRAADTANYHARQQGGQTRFFSIQMQTEESDRLQLEADLQQALVNQELVLYYQPIISLQTCQVSGFEALVRWHHPTRGWVGPNIFIPLAEQTGLIIPLGQWVLEEACRQMHHWQTELAEFLPLSVAVNLSGIQLVQPNLATTIQAIWEQAQIQGLSLKLEVTESLLMENGELVIQQLQRLRSSGIQICIDDFGTGYSSLAYLHSLPINTLKIDRSFVDRMTLDGKNLSIVKTILTLAKTLGLSVVAEGIETANQFDELRSLNCTEGQGYLFAKPLPPQDLALWLHQAKSPHFLTTVSATHPHYDSPLSSAC